MSISLKLHETITKYNCLQQWTQRTRQFLLAHPTHYKIALLANHFFRSAAMAIFMTGLPFSALVNHGICFGASLFYRLTVENNCAYKFALPAFAGAVAFSSSSIIPLAAYISYVVLTVDYDVNAQCS